MVEEFAVGLRAARGAGVVPWQLDLMALEEEVFARAVSQPASQRSLTVAGCRILAGQFRAKVAAHHARAVGLVGRSQACPFDLHALLPMPLSDPAAGSDAPGRPGLAAAALGHRAAAPGDRAAEAGDRPAAAGRAPRARLRLLRLRQHAAAGESLADAALRAAATSGRLRLRHGPARGAK